MRPATLILAGDEFLAQEALDALREQATSEGFAAEEVSPEDPRAFGYAIETPSLFDAGRFVIVRDAEDLPADTHRVLAAWLEQPPEGIALVLVASGVGGSKLAKLLPADAIVRAEGVPPWKAPEWVGRRFRERGRKCTAEGAAALVDAVGSDLRDLAAAVERLVETTRGLIGPDEVTAEFQGIESRLYQFVDAVFDRDRPAALKRLRSLIEQGENPIGLVAALARQLRTIAFVSGGDRRPAAVIARELGLKGEGPVRRALRQVKRFDAEDVRRAYRLLADADVALKSEEDDPLVLELVVDEIAAERASGRA
jgi:DNA polymerase-3 subunit delta